MTLLFQNTFTNNHHTLIFMFSDVSVIRTLLLLTNSLLALLYVFLYYPTQHCGYRCLDLATRKIIISRHVPFDETSFPFLSVTPNQPPSYSFLDDPSPITIFWIINSCPSPTITSSSDGPFLESHSSPPASTTPTDTPPIISKPLPSTPSPQPPPSHPIVTLEKCGISKPVSRLNLHTTNESPMPKSHIHPLRDPNWSISMQDKFSLILTKHRNSSRGPKGLILYAPCGCLKINTRRMVLLIGIRLGWLLMEKLKDPISTLMRYSDQLSNPPTFSLFLALPLLDSGLFTN